MRGEDSPAYSRPGRPGFFLRGTHEESDIWLRFACIGAAAETDATQGIRRAHPLNRSSAVYNCHKWDLEWEAAFESFFQHEGSNLPNGSYLRLTARRALAERAYWGCFSNLLRGDFRLSLNLPLRDHTLPRHHDLSTRRIPAPAR